MELKFTPAATLPEVAAGDNKIFIILTEHENGKRFVLPAYYLNRFPLEYEDCKCDTDKDHDDGCPTTGWFYDESNFEYEHCYWKVTGTVLAWAPLPTAADVQAALSVAA